MNHKEQTDLLLMFLRLVVTCGFTIFFVVDVYIHYAQDVISNTLDKVIYASWPAKVISSLKPKKNK